MGIFKMLFSRSHERVDKDTSEDVLLLLYLLDKCGGKISDKTIFDAQIKLMKLVFLSEYQMASNGIKGFNFFFNIFKHGPSSKEVLNLIDHLVDRGLVEKKGAGFLLSKDGKITIDDFVSYDGKNRSIFGIVDRIVNEYGKLTTEVLLKKIYAMKIKPLYVENSINIGEEVKNAGGKPGKRLLMKLSVEDVKKELDVPPEWVETINILLNPEFLG